MKDVEPSRASSTVDSTEVQTKMLSPTLDVLPVPDLPLVPRDRVDEIHARWERVVEHGRASLEEVLRIGELLQKCKEIVGHGKWGAWCDGNLPFSARNAQHYMQLFKNSELVKSANVADSAEAMRLIRQRKKAKANLSTCEDADKRKPVESGKSIAPLSPMSVAILNTQSALILLGSNASESPDIWEPLVEIEADLFALVSSEPASVHPQIIENHDLLAKLTSST